MKPPEIEKGLLQLYQRHPDEMDPQEIGRLIVAVRVGEGLEYAEAYIEDADKIKAEELEPWRGMSVKAVLDLAANIGQPKARPPRRLPPERAREISPSEGRAFALVEATRLRSKHGLGSPPSLERYRANEINPSLADLDESIAWTADEGAQAKRGHFPEAAAYLASNGGGA